MPDLNDLVDQINAARVQELEALVQQARHDYYNGTPTVVDDVFDAWIDELSELKVDSPAVTAIGAPPSAVTEWKKASHGIQMGSLDKVNTLEEITAWILGVDQGKFEPLLVTEKLDGISIHIRYEKGSFSQAITLGDGSVGEDISNNVVRMKGVPARLQDKRFTGSLRGEVVLLKSDLVKHFPDKANTRNAASGTAKRYDGLGCEHLWVIFYQVVEGKEFATEGEQFTWLQDQGLRIPNWYVTAMAPGVKTPHDIWIEYQQTKRAQLDYDIDGLVVRIDNLVKQISLGEKDGRPKGAVAFKFSAITRETTISRIDWQVGATGRITPVANFHPVNVLGAEISYASLYNLKNIQDLELDVGCKVLIARANDVIPKIVSVRIKSGTVAKAPTNCPVCGSGTMMDGEYLICPNTSDCSAQAVGRIKRYVKELDIKEWGETLIEKLVEGGHVKRVSDLYTLTGTQLAGIERMAEKSAQNVLKTLWDKNPVALENLLGACSIPLCATSTLKMVVDAGFDTFDNLRAADPTALAQVPGLGPIKAHSLHRWLVQHGSLIDDLLAVGVKIKPRVKGNLTGLSFCFTGPASRPRAELEELARAAGGEVKASVTKKLSFLVMADSNSTSTKAQAARKNGTKVISEEDYLRMVGEL